MLSGAQKHPPISVLTMTTKRLSQLFERNPTWKEGIISLNEGLKLRAKGDYTESLKLFQKAIEKLKVKQEYSEEQKGIVQTALISTMAHIMAERINTEHFEESQQILNQLLYNIKDKKQFQQACDIVFGVKSLLHLMNFRIREQAIPSNNQLVLAYFWQLIGQVKLSALNKDIIPQFKKEEFKQETKECFMNSLDICMKNNLKKLSAENTAVLEQMDPQFADQSLRVRNKQVFKQIRNTARQHVIRLVIVSFLKKQHDMWKNSVMDSDFPINRIMSPTYIRAVLLFGMYIFSRLPKYKTQSSQIQSVLLKTKHQKNSLILQRISRTYFFEKSHKIFSKKLDGMWRVINKILLQHPFQKLKPNKQFYSTPRKNSYEVKRMESAIMTGQFRRSNQTQQQSQNSKIKIKKYEGTLLLEKLWRECVQGQYLVKCNYNNDQRSVKFLQLTNQQLRWSDNEKHILSSYSSYKLKNIKGLVYGKVTQNLHSVAYQDLEPQKCFSIIGKDRTLDFYCQDEQGDVRFWLPGISYHLKQRVNPQFEIYTLGRVLWKFVNLKSQLVIKRTHKHQRKMDKYRLRFALADRIAALKDKSDDNFSHSIKSGKRPRLITQF